MQAQAKPRPTKGIAPAGATAEARMLIERLTHGTSEMEATAIRSESKELGSKTAMDFININELAISCLDDLQALFRAINELAPAHSQAKQLSKVGLYLADDWSNMFDVQREIAAKELQA